MDKLHEKFPCRSKQINFLDLLLGKQSVVLPPVLFVYGQTAVGKTTILLKYLRVIKAKFAYINCIECYTNKLLHESIITQLLGTTLGIKCDNFMDLIHILKNAYKEEFFKQPIVIILDGIENIHDKNNTLTVFGKLQELTSIFSLSVIFISKLLPEKFYLDISYIPVYFPQYSRDDFFQILQRYKPLDCNDHFFENYLNSALTVFLRTTRDFMEMKNLILNNFPIYCTPVDKGDISSNDVAGLWRHVAPHLKNSLNSVYLGITNSIEDIETKSTDVITKKAICAFDLPYYAKYFLIAAYLASYNSSKHDKRLFLKNSGKQKKRNVKKKINENITNELLGPKAFSMDRLLAIFYAILEEKASLTVNLMSQIASLVELRLLVKIGDSNIEKPKYKCLVGLHYVDSVAKTLGFNLNKYLLE